ncbi:hypothetical protein ACHAWT_003515 [Skeletonema menzelii]
MEVDEINKKLLGILSTEISRDGGASLVRDLKDYASIDSLLRRSSAPKLLTFLETFPEIFDVERETLPHVVYLLKYDHANLDDVPSSQQADAKEILKDRMICILKKESGKNERRNGPNSTRYVMHGVNAGWLLKQCKNQLHRYLRLSGMYKGMYSDCKHFNVVGSDEWNVLVAAEFTSIAKEFCDCDDGRLILRDESHVDVETLASILADKVDEDGGTHISLGLLLQRYPELRNLLGGQDLMRLKEENQICFDRMTVFMKNNQIYLQSKLSKKVGRMEVDENGLFSVTSSKWGNAFASTMANHCRSMLSKEPENTVAIDLTASVGGMCLPLSKTFERVIAVEIDSHRANLCKRNMLRYDAAEHVDVRNEDSMKIIPDLSNELSQQARVVALDPPWGGKHYKSEDKPIMMGQWNLVEVVKAVSCHLYPTLVGIRLPVSFRKGEFFESLKDAGVVIHRTEVRKVGPQLFIILLL